MRSKRRAAVLGTAVSAAALLAAWPVGADFRVTPSLAVSERYESNVFFESGFPQDDFVTVIAPEVKLDYFGRPVEGTLLGSFSVNSYAKHSDLNYASASGSASLNLDQVVGKLDKRAKLLLTDSVYYTPELPAFVYGTAGFQPFARGIQPQRVNTFSNTGTATGNYTLTTSTNWQAVYSHSIIQFGSVPGGVVLQTPVFRTIFQTVNTGPQFGITKVDSISLNYQYQKADFQGGSPGFHTHGGTVGWTRVLSPTLTLSLGAGATLVSSNNRITELGNASLSWAHKNTSMVASFSRAVTPSFAIEAVPVTSNVASMSINHQVSAPLTITLRGSYARSSSVVTGMPLTFTSYDASLRLEYLIKRWLAGIFEYDYSKFSDRSAGFNSTFDRNLVVVTLRATWQ